jgi:hypothetical protein
MKRDRVGHEGRRLPAEQRGRVEQTDDRDVAAVPA